MKSVYWGDLCPRGQDMGRDAFADFRQSMACFAVLWKDFGWVWGGQGGAVTLIQLRDDCGFRWVVTGTQRKPGLCWRGLDYSRKVCSVWPRPARNKELLFPWDGGGRGRSMLAVKNAPANEGDERDAGSIPGSGRSSGVENGNPFQYSCLENPMDRRVWQATVHGVTRVGHGLATKQPSPPKESYFWGEINIPSS